MDSRSCNTGSFSTSCAISIRSEYQVGLAHCGAMSKSIICDCLHLLITLERSGIGGKSVSKFHRPVYRQRIPCGLRVWISGCKVLAFCNGVANKSIFGVPHFWNTLSLYGSVLTCVRWMLVCSVCFVPR